MVPPFSVLAQDSIEDVLGEFDRPATDASKPSGAETLSERRWRVSGWFDMDMAWSMQRHTPPSSDLDYAGLVVLRPRLDLTLDYKLIRNWQTRVGAHGFFDFAYAIRGRNEFSDEVLSDLEKEVELDEAYLEGPLGKVELKLGRQVVVWGESDIFRPLDIINPIDIRDPVFTDTGGRRLPVWITRVDWESAGWSFSGLAVHENRDDKIPPYGSDFYPFDFPLPPREDNSLSLANTGLGLRASRFFKGWDLSICSASVLQEQDLVGITPDISIRPTNRVSMLGTSANLATGNWLFKTDLALLYGLKYYQLPDEVKTRADLAGGFDYSGFRDTFLTFEIIFRHLFDMDPAYQDDIDYPGRNVLAFGFRYARSFWQERLKASALVQLYGFNHGGFERLSCSYSLSDGVRISTGVMLFQGGDNYIFRHIGKNSRIFLKYQYAF